MRAALGIFCTAAAYQLYRFLGQPNGVPAIAALAAHYLLSAVIALWVVADARERPHWKLYDFGSFVFFLWPVIAPIYLFQTRGLRGFGTIGLFFIVFLSAMAFAIFMGYPASLQR
jgi:hypothetical protein